MSLPIYQNKDSVSNLLHPFEHIKSVIAVAASKGGVGKSTVTVNLALALKLKGYKVGIMDTDIYGPSIRKMLPEDHPPFQKGSSIVPASCNGIQMISMAYFRQENEVAAIRAPIANRLIGHFIQNTQWDDLDFLLIDFPPGTGDIQLTLAQKGHLTGALMVTTPQEIALLDVRKAISLFEYVHIPILGIVENMSFYQIHEAISPLYLFGKEGGQRLAHEVGAPFLGQIPLDPQICTCGDEGTSIFSFDTSSQRPVTRAFQSLAEHVTQHSLLLKQEKEEGIGNFELMWNQELV